VLKTDFLSDWDSELEVFSRKSKRKKKRKKNGKLKSHLRFMIALTK
jgi:hypothetical protein